MVHQWCLSVAMVTELREGSETLKTSFIQSEEEQQNQQRPLLQPTGWSLFSLCMNCLHIVSLSPPPVGGVACSRVNQHFRNFSRFLKLPVEAAINTWTGFTCDGDSLSWNNRLRSRRLSQDWSWWCCLAVLVQQGHAVQQVSQPGSAEPGLVGWVCWFLWIYLYNLCVQAGKWVSFQPESKIFLSMLQSDINQLIWQLSHSVCVIVEAASLQSKKTKDCLKSRWFLQRLRS